MKRLGYLLTGMLTVLVLAGGCFITDNQQVVKTVSTTEDIKLDDEFFYEGTAKLKEGAQTATIWGDGYTTEHANFQDQWDNIDVVECELDCCSGVRLALEDANWADEYVAMDFLSKWANACKHRTRGKNLDTAANSLCAMMSHLEAQEGKKLDSQSVGNVFGAIQEWCVDFEGIELPCADMLPKADDIEQGCQVDPVVEFQTFAVVNIGHTPNINYFHGNTMCDVTIGDCGMRMQGSVLQRLIFPNPPPGYPHFGWSLIDTGDALCNRATPGVLTATAIDSCSAGLQKMGIDMLDVLKALSSATETEEGLVLTLSADNFSLTLTQGEISKAMDLGDAEQTILIDPASLTIKMAFDLTDARNETLLHSYADFLRTASPGAFTAHVTYNDLSFSYPYLGIDEDRAILDTITRYIQEVQTYGVDKKVAVEVPRAGRTFF